MISNINKPGQSLPNNPGDGAHRPNHPEKPNPPVGPGHPEKPNPPVGPGHPNHPEKPEGPINVIVNGVDKVLPVGTKKLSYEDVVKLAYGNYNSSSTIIYSVAYSNGPVENKKGVLVKGDSVHIQKGMIFNVGCSNKS